VKIYFSDLGYMHALLGNIHSEGTLRASAIENFAYLELERKLDTTHKIAYYRKKSGADITFILEDESTGKVTPIHITTRDTIVFPKVFESFDSDYHDSIERFMLINHSLSNRSDHA
jgi:predicted AAA+ superfamily ATPase